MAYNSLSWSFCLLYSLNKVQISSSYIEVKQKHWHPDYDLNLDEKMCEQETLISYDMNKEFCVSQSDGITLDCVNKYKKFVENNEVQMLDLVYCAAQEQRKKLNLTKIKVIYPIGKTRHIKKYGP